MQVDVRHAAVHFFIIARFITFIETSIFSLLFVLYCGPDVSTRLVTRRGAGIIADSDYFVLSFVRRMRVTFENGRGLRIYVAGFDQEVL
uniref:Secreted protein n=1 Tax=Romanomermis culicivorax TaxID=13658 RepID=A0A915IVX2_ROMCU